MPSTAMRLVRSSASPGLMERRSISRPAGAVPSIVPLTMGRVTASVISVWPPQSTMRWATHSRRRPSIAVSTSEGVAPRGKRTVAKNQRGTAPQVAMSLALTSTAQRPSASVVNVTGSELTASNGAREPSGPAATRSRAATSRPR